MRIAFILLKFPVLSETFILNQITNLIDVGHEVDIFAINKGSDPEVHPDVEKYKLLQRTRYLAIPRNKAVKLLKGLGVFAQLFLTAPLLALRSVNFVKHGHEALSLRLLFLARHFTESYDITHCHYGLLGDIAVKLKTLGANIGKIVVSFHGYDITVHLQQHGVAVYDDLFQKGDLFLPISENWRRKLIELKCPPPKVIVHHMGVDTAKFKFKPKKLGQGETVQLISIARLTEKKGLAYSIRAVSQVRATYPDIAYTIIGDGPLRGELEALVNQEGCSGVIHLVGWKTQEEVRALLEQAHIMLATSVTSTNGDQEGIPVVIMEAMAMGLPIVSTEHSGIPELVQDGVSGYLVPERNVSAIRQQLEVLIANPEQWETMGSAGSAFVREHFDNRKLDRHIVDLYEDLLT